MDVQAFPAGVTESRSRGLLVAISTHEALEQSVFDALRQDGATPIILDTTAGSLRFAGESSVIQPFFRNPEPFPYLAKREMEPILRREGVQTTLAIGADAAAALAKFGVTAPNRALLLAPSDIAFSMNRTSQLTALGSVLGESWSGPWTSNSLATNGWIGLS